MIENNLSEAAEEVQLPSAAAAAGSGATANKKNENESMNSHYGNKASALHILSLLLNTALMIYAHLSPLGEIYSSQNPELTSSVPSNQARALTSSFTRSRLTQEESSETGGKCNNEDDLQNWIITQGETQRPIMSNYCSREWLGNPPVVGAVPCFLNATCIELCFVQVYNYTTECASCFSLVPECSVAAGCITSW